MQTIVMYEGAELKWVEPALADGGKCVIFLYHVGCCIHANDQERNQWYVH